MSLPAVADTRFRYLGLKLGLFVGVGLLLGAGLLMALAVRQGYFSPKSPVYFEASSGSDLRPGMAVKLSGFKIGEVHRVDLNQWAKVDVEMQIEDRYMKWIKADSIATLAREGMIGDSFISITSGNTALPALRPEEKLRFAMSSSLGDIALDVRNRVVPVIDELHGFLHYANDPKGDIRGSFSELHKLTVELHDTRRQLYAALKQVDHLVATDMPATLNQTRSTLLRADASLQQLEKTIPVLTTQAGQSLQALSQASDKAGEVAAKAGKLLDETAPRLNSTLVGADGLMRDSRAAVNAARSHWPFKGPELSPLPSVPTPPAK
jgi:phospholipid/cholesterol/gamma-HCH transport system substrate-binding protein